jgi:hypothetical protein
MRSEVPNEPQTTLEVKRYSPAQADEAMTRALRGRQGRLTRADAITVSGLPSHLVDESLERLLRRYRSRLEVTDEGELLYSFDPSLARRDEPTLAERARAVGRTLARAGMWVFKAWIMATLVIYLVAFVVLLLAVMFGGRSRDDDRGWGGNGGGGFGWIWWLFMPDWRYGHYHQDAWGRPLQAPRASRRGQLGGGPKKKFIYSVFDFVFGPARPPVDPLEEEREILAYIRSRDGRITATDLVQLFGWSYPKAEEEVTRLLCDYDGDPEVTDEGVIIYSFPKLLRAAGEGARGQTALVKPAWERLETRPKLTGNSRGADVAITVFAGFNLLMSFFAAGWARMRFGLAGPGWDFALTFFPLAFFAIFLAIPLGRLAARALGDGRREARNQRRLALKEVLAANGAPLPATPALDALLVPLEGEPEAGPGGQMLVRFPRVAEERAALARFLSGVDVAAEKRVGKVIFGGDDDDVEKVRAELEDEAAERPRLPGK